MKAPNTFLKDFDEFLPEYVEDSKGDGKHLPSRDEPIPQGQRNSFLASLAGSMRHRGMSSESIGTALLAENKKRCQPPLPEKEVLKIASSIGRYAPW